MSQTRCTPASPRERRQMSIYCVKEGQICVCVCRYYVWSLSSFSNGFRSCANSSTDVRICVRSCTGYNSYSRANTGIANYAIIVYTFVETRAVRDRSWEYDHRHGLLSTMDHAALVSMLKLENRSTRLFETSARRMNRRVCHLHLCRKLHPISVSEAVASPHADIWRYAMVRELSSLPQTSTFTLV